MASEARRMRCHSAFSVSPALDRYPKGSATAHTQGTGNPSPTPFVPDYTVGEAFRLPPLHLSLPLEGKVPSEARRMRCHSSAARRELGHKHPHPRPLLCKGRWHGGAVTEGLFDAISSSVHSPNHAVGRGLAPAAFLCLFADEKRQDQSPALQNNPSIPQTTP